MDKEKNTEAVSEENIYCLNGRVPVKKAIPFGLQHVLAMFVSNLAPVLIVCSAAFVRGSENHLSPAEITQLLQCAMFAAGIGTCLQLYPVWKIGSRLPIVMGVSFTFLGSLLMICTNPELGYEGMVGAVIAGGIFEGLVGMSAKYWKRFLTPVVSACVVIAIGLSLLSVGMDSWGVVSSSGRIFHTGCVSGCPLSVKRCIQEPERTGWSGLWVSSVHCIYCGGDCTDGRFFRNYKDDRAGWCIQPSKACIFYFP